MFHTIITITLSASPRPVTFEDRWVFRFLTSIALLERNLIGNKTKFSTFTCQTGCRYRLKGNKTDLIVFPFGRNMSSYFDIKSCKHLLAGFKKTIWVKQKRIYFVECKMNIVLQSYTFQIDKTVLSSYLNVNLQITFTLHNKMFWGLTWMFTITLFNDLAVRFNFCWLKLLNLLTLEIWPIIHLFLITLDNYFFLPLLKKWHAEKWQMTSQQKKKCLCIVYKYE